ncbi:MAG: peptide chain release factor N(5)-glutamine methyltransferase [Deltaproteobacteria bacterium]|nr:peptide chain release factor N(5)-glutamine methyltransferase [Deltaproteobacteria bacterium]
MPGALTVGEVLGRSTRWLAERGSPSARLDAEVLIAAALGIRRLDLYLAPERPLADDERDRLRELVRRRGAGEPIAYIRGTREFYGLDFAVTPAVLIPRPETEVLVDEVLARLATLEAPAPAIADVGTGSGAIACAIALRDPRVRVVATDASAAAIEVARRNVAAHGLEARVEIRCCDLLDAVPREPCLDAVVSNPPYVADDEAGLLDASVREFEPHSALFAGPDGMSVTRRLVEEAVPRLRRGAPLVVEVGTPAQAARVEALLLGTPGLCDVHALPDAAGVVRGYAAVRTSSPNPDGAP